MVADHFREPSSSASLDGSHIRRDVPPPHDDLHAHSVGASAHGAHSGAARGASRGASHDAEAHGDALDGAEALDDVSRGAEALGDDDTRDVGSGAAPHGDVVLADGDALPSGPQCRQVGSLFAVDGVGAELGRKSKD